MNGDWTPFDIDTVKMLIDLFDADSQAPLLPSRATLSGPARRKRDDRVWRVRRRLEIRSASRRPLSFVGPEGSFQLAREWQGVFRRFDTDSSGTIAGPELANAMRQFNYNLNPHILKLVRPIPLR